MLASLALRNIFRQKRRSLSTMLAISFGFTAIIVFGGIVNNVDDVFRKQAIVSERLGHLTIAKKDFFEKGQLDIKNYIWTKQEIELITRKLNENISNIKLVSPRLGVMGMATNGEQSTIFISESLIPAHNLQISNEVLGTHSPDDGLLDPVDTTQIAIGEALAEMLDVKTGDFITLYTMTLDGMANAIDATIRTVFNTGNAATNDKFILLNLDYARELYDTEGSERIIVLLNDETQIEETRKDILELLNNQGFNADIKSWNELSLFYEKVTQMFDVLFNIILVVTAVVILLTLLNTMVMSVMERTQELGTLRAIGLRKNQLSRLIVMEGVFLAFVSFAVAIPVIFIVVNVISALSITFIPPISSSPVQVLSLVSMSNAMVTAFVFIIVTTIASIIASRHIRKKKIVDSLNHY